jgi:cytochrome c oxidase cbb3-type subunit 3
MTTFHGLGVWLAMASLSFGLAACQREERDFRGNPPVAETQEKIALVPLSPGPGGPTIETSGIGASYENNAYHVSNGKTLFSSFNCNGCHANGGGGSGPPLMDDRWIYGGSIENIAATIREGRPNGMPSFRGKIPDDQIWELAAYVRSMSGQLRKDVAPSRNDDLNPGPSENRRPAPPPVAGGTIPPGAEQPQ